MNIAVTGGMGFIGQEFLATYGMNFASVTVVDYYRALLAQYEEARYPCLPRVYRSLSRADNVLDPREFIRDFKKLNLDVVIHLGAVANTTDMGFDGAYGETDLWANNVDYTRELCEIASADGSRSHMVFASSAATYGRKPFLGFPANPYGLTKVIGEKLVARMSTRTVALRFFNVFGKYEDHKGHMSSLPFKMAQAYKKKEKISLHSPDAKRDFVPVSEVASVINDMTQRVTGLFGGLEQPHTVRDVGTCKTTSVKELDDHMQKIFKSESMADWGEMPDSLKGRYQDFTQANPHINHYGAGWSTYHGLTANYSPENIDVES